MTYGKPLLSVRQRVIINEEEVDMAYHDEPLWEEDLDEAEAECECPYPHYDDYDPYNFETCICKPDCDHLRR